LNSDPSHFHAAVTAPLAAALAARDSVPAPEPVAAVTLNAARRLAVIGEADAAIGWAERLAGQREVTVVVAAPVELPEEAAFAALVTPAPVLSGHLGAFRVDGAAAPAEFDVVLDLSQPPLLRRVELPQGYVAPGRDPLDQALAVIDLLGFEGEFEKPRYVALKERTCAHSRARKAGCSNCIDVCATQAISGAGDSVSIDPYLCQGCGTCATVCPSGAIAYQYPRVADSGLVIKKQLAAFREAGGGDPLLLFHSAEAGRRLLADQRRAGRGLPAHVIPVESWSADAIGLDLLLGAVALGATRVAVLGAGSHDLAPLQRQAALGQVILGGLGYAGEFLRIIDVDRGDWLADLMAWSPPAPLPSAEFRLLADKRTTLEFVIDYLVKHAPAPAPAAALDLPAGAPFGTVTVSEACTLCMSCVGACPAGALKAAADAPRLSFLERNCLQCGLCANTCPEGAVTLSPRLLLQDRRQERILREAEIFRCTACGKPMGAAPTIERMVAQLSGHSMFATPAARARLTMCADCRVVDLIKNEGSLNASEMTE
jgi:ferredoxin